MSVMSLFTKETCRIAAAKSVEVRRAMKAARELKALIAAPNDLPTVTTEDFRLERLARVRKQLRMIDSLVEQERDPVKIDRLASASYRLCEQERILAGRPLPGSLKPELTGKRAKGSPGLQIIEQIAVPMTNAPAAPPEQQQEAPTAQPATEQPPS